MLNIDCNECAGAHDLRNPRCLAGVVNTMVVGAEPDTIILKRYIHKRYRDMNVKAAVVLAKRLASINRAMSSLETPSDRRCRTCPASANAVLRLFKERLLKAPLGSEPVKDSLHKQIVEEIGNVSCGQAPSCVANTLRMSVQNKW